MQLPLIRLRYSNQELFLVATLHMFAFVCLVFCQFSLTAKLIFISSLALSAWVNTKQIKEGVKGVGCDGGGWYVVDKDGQKMRIKVKPRSIVMPFLVVFMFHGERGSKVLLLFSDTMAAQEFRAFKVALRVAPGPT